VARRERAQVQVADRAAGEAAELEMDERVWVRHADRLAHDGLERAVSDGRPGQQPRRGQSGAHGGTSS
jgi:hypothetical protein